MLLATKAYCNTKLLWFFQSSNIFEHFKIQAYDKNIFFLLRRNLGHIYFHIKSGIADMSVGLRFVEGFHINTIEQYFDENNLVI